MPIDPSNPVVALCAAGMACESGSEEARRNFQEAWNARRDDYDAAIAAHYIARNQTTTRSTLEWNTRAVTHCERLRDGREAELLPSLYLNLADSLMTAGRRDEALTAIQRAAQTLAALPSDGYTAFVAQGVARLQARLAEEMGVS